MVRLYALLFVIQVVLTIAALISCLSAEEDDIRVLPRLLWALIILLFPVVGPITWFLAGRPVPESGTGAASAGQAGPAPTRPSRPLAPDDDPEFLRSLDAEQARRNQQLFDQWEADLRRREEELRRREADDPPYGQPQPES